jgi:hypothetical protein
MRVLRVSEGSGFRLPEPGTGDTYDVALIEGNPNCYRSVIEDIRFQLAGNYRVAVLLDHAVKQRLWPLLPRVPTPLFQALVARLK